MFIYFSSVTHFSSLCKRRETLGWVKQIDIDTEERNGLL